MIYCRTAPSLGALERTPEEAWGTPEYEGDTEEPTVFFGLYGLPDFYALWRHKGKKWILWAGSDIRHFIGGYWLDRKGDIKIEPKALAQWINQECENWVENEVERNALSHIGIASKICPSFLGDMNKFETNYQWSEKPKVYTSVSGNNFELYGWDKIPKLARENPDIEFHCYGPSSYAPLLGIDNVFLHGRVPKEQMNEEIKTMQGALRLVEIEGFSEIIAKSVLMGQWPVSLIPYPCMLSIEELGTLINRKEPNIQGREYYRKILNIYPWNVNK